MRNYISIPKLEKKELFESMEHCHSRAGLQNLWATPVEKMSEMFETKSVTDIANHFGVSVTAARYHTNKLGLRRSLSDANSVRYRKVVTLLTPVQEQIIYGSLLGDACLYRQDRRTHFTLKVGFAHGEDQLEYLKHKRMLVGGSKISIRRPQEGDGHLGKPMWQFAYSNTQGLLPVESVVMVGGRKTVSNSWLSKIGLHGIAVWYQDDGNVVVSKTGKISFVRLSTNAFSDSELDLLVDFLHVNGVRSVSPCRTGNKDQKILNLFRDSDLREFLTKLKPYSVPCLHYKFPV